MSKQNSIQQLWPAARTIESTHGLYLDQIDTQNHNNTDIFIYANLVSSVDGRIAIAGKQGRMQTPSALTTKLDWTLFKELQAQADCLITHGGYFRSLSRGELGNILRIGDGQSHDYLHNYRHHNQLAAQPDLLILSRTLNFELPPTGLGDDRNVTVLTGQLANSAAICHLEDNGIRVIQHQTSELIDAQAVYAALKTMGVKSAYLQTGPQLLGSMLLEKLINRLYLTISLRLIGGDQFLSLLQGELPMDGVPLELVHLYLDNQSQLFACFDIPPMRP